MAVNEKIITGKKYRVLADKATKLWNRYSFWNKASDTEFDDGKDAQTKLGAIDGITDSLTATSSNIAASAKAVSTLNSNLGKVSVYVGDDGKLHFVDATGADSVIPFSSGVEFCWGVYGLSDHMNLKNTGSVTFEVLKYTASGKINIYGTDDPTNITHTSNVTLLGNFKVAKDAKATIQTDKTYPYIVLYPVYETGWTSGNKVNTVKVTM